MTYENYQANQKYRQFGNILIVLGIIPIAHFVLIFFVVLLGFPGFIIGYIKDIVLVTMLILLLVNNKRIQDELRAPDFTTYYHMMMVYGICSIVQFLLYDLLDFVWSYNILVVGVIAYVVIRFIASVFVLIAWIKLGKYGTSLRTPVGDKIRTGVILLMIGVGINFLFQISDIVSTFLYYNATMEVLLIVFSLVGSIISIVGYFIVGIQVKKMIPFRSISEPLLDQISTAYIPPPPKGAVVFCIRCGIKLLPGGDFCPGCGWKIPKTYE